MHHSLERREAGTFSHGIRRAGVDCCGAASDRADHDGNGISRCLEQAVDTLYDSRLFSRAVSARHVISLAVVDCLAFGS